MVRELRELSLTVFRCSAALEMPEVIEARDDLARRFVNAALSTSGARLQTTRSQDTFVDGEDDDQWVSLTLDR